MKRRLNNEAQLEKELGRFFKRLKKEVLKGLNEYWSDYQLLQGQVNLMLSPIHEAHKEYYEIIRKYKLREYQLGKAEAKRLTRLANKDKVALKAATTLGIQGFVDKDKNSLFGTIPKAEEDLLNRTFRASENTLNRVDSQLNRIISDGYREGKGINKVANDITQRFDQLATWEARRIARTEINTSHNQATRDQYKADGVEYTQWIAAGDDRTRDSHAEVDGEIIPIDGKYSNGLSYPGDMSGPLEEWINCRCSNAPFVVPYGYMAPSFSPFRESDLVPINDDVIKEPTPEQLDQNLSDEQKAKYEEYTKAIEEAQRVIDSPLSLPNEILQARTMLEYNQGRLNQLKMVANEGLAKGYHQIIGAVTSPPETPTDDQLQKNLTNKELKEYKELKQIIEWADDVQNSKYISEKGKKLALEKKNKALPRFKQLTQKALGLTPKPKPKPKTTPKPKAKEPAKPKLNLDENAPKDLNNNIVLTKEQADILTFEELAEHHGATYEGVKTYDYDGRKYHTFTQSFENGETFTLRFEQGAVKSYAKKGWVSPNEIINEVFKTPEALKRQTNEIWFKNTNHGISHQRFNKSGYDSLNPRTGGYNISKPWYRLEQGEKKDPNHRIVINPKYFKGATGKMGFIWEPVPNEARNWKMTIHHEFTHSIDNSREYYEGKQWHRDWTELSSSKEYRKILKEEPDFTWYANTQASENFAEHGGYVARMLNNPSEQNKKVEIQIHNDKGGITEKSITFEEYKDMYPLHYEYFTKLFKEVVPRY